MSGQDLGSPEDWRNWGQLGVGVDDAGDSSLPHSYSLVGTCLFKSK